MGMQAGACTHQLHGVGGAHGVAAVQHALPDALQQRPHLRATACSLSLTLVRVHTLTALTELNQQK
jgi:hypothetical protein